MYDADQVIVREILDGRWDQLARDHGVRYVVKRARAAEMLVMNLNGAALPEIDPSRRVFRVGDESIYAV